MSPLPSSPSSPVVPSSPDAGSDRVVEAACAKINLSLHVLGRRPDGYHDLESLVVFADVHDTIMAEPAADLSLAVTGPMAGSLARALTGDDSHHAGATGDNIVIAAARALAARAGRIPAARLTLIKRLPVASGIGGGSADAAATLRALCRLWRLDDRPEDLIPLARDLGADVPVCLIGRAVTMTGVGERLTPAPPLPSAGLVLINPLRPVATPQVFKARRGPFSAAAPLTDAPADLEDLVAALAARTNDLEPPARTVEPAIDAVLAALEAAPGRRFARMSGSGATCFALFADVAAARAAEATLRQRHPDWWLAAGALVTDTAQVAARTSTD